MLGIHKTVVKLPKTHIKRLERRVIVLPRKKELVEKQPKARAASSPDAREKQMIALAVNLAEEQLRNGTASAQVITHYLKLGTMREKIEREILEKQRDLVEAKTDHIKSAKRNEELVSQAIEAMRSYTGNGETHEYE